MYVNVNAVNIDEKEQLFIELCKLLIINEEEQEEKKNDRYGNRGNIQHIIDK